jgi:hypothetical protein
VTAQVDAGRAAPNGMEVAEHLPIGGDKRGLVVTNRVLGTEVTHQTLGRAQVRPRHGGEQVVLDLEIEAAEEKSGKPAAANIAGGEDLTAQEAQLGSLTEHRHAGVIGGEGAAEIEAEQPLVDDDEDDGAQWREHPNDRVAAVNAHRSEHDRKFQDEGVTGGSNQDGALGVWRFS